MNSFSEIFPLLSSIVEILFHPGRPYQEEFNLWEDTIEQDYYFSVNRDKERALLKDIRFRELVLSYTNPN